MLPRLGSESRVVIVGASLAGVRVAESLRREGYRGRLTLIGAETHFPPYDRPPLSKEVLLGGLALERARLVIAPDLEAEVILGDLACSVNLDGGTVRLGNGVEHSFDALVLATGATPRALRVEGAELPGVQSFRSAEDCRRLCQAFERQARIGVIGAGFIGSEVASSARARTREVVVVDACRLPMAEVVGPAVAEHMLGQHRKHGTTIRTEVGVRSFGGRSRVERMNLTDGSVEEVEAVVVGIGVTPETGWIDGGTICIEHGVVCDEFGRAMRVNGTGVMDNVVAVGDVARWLHPVFGKYVGGEHWTGAVQQGEVAAKTLLYGATAGSELVSLPYFWSDQYGTRYQFVGIPGPDMSVEESEGHSCEWERAVISYRDQGRMVGGLCINWPRRLNECRKEILKEAQGLRVGCKSG